MSKRPVSNPRPRQSLAMKMNQQQTIKRSLALPFSGKVAAIAFVVVAVLAIGGWLLYNQMRTYTLTIATGGKTGRAYIFAEALAEVVAEAEPRIRIQVVESAGSVENMEWLQSGRIDLALGQTDVDAGSQIRTVAYLYPELFQLAVRVGSGIQNPADLKGKRVMTPAVGSGSYNSFQFVMSHYGLKAEDLTLVPLPADEINQAFLDGKADAVFRNLPLGEPATRELLATGQAQLVPFEQVAAMRVPKPYMMGITIPKGTYRAADPAVPGEDLNTIGVQNVLYANVDVPEDIVKSLTRVLFEHQNALVSRNSLAAFISSPLDYEDIIGPSLHAGAQAYYDREKPSFFQEHYDELTFLFMIAPLFGSAYLAMRSRMQARQKKQVNSYQQQLIDLVERSMEIIDFNTLREVECEMESLLAQVMRDLDHGEFELEDVQTFSFGWDKAMTSLRIRQNTILLQSGQKPLALQEGENDSNRKLEE